MRLPLGPLLALAGLLPAAIAAAGPRLHGIPARVRAGESVEIRWTGLGVEAHEVELELSLAGGRWVRVSPELESREGSFAWRVPAGLAGPSRLRLKYGGQWFEAEGEVSTPFVIEADARSAALPTPDPAFSEWWFVGTHARGARSAQVAGSAALEPVMPSLAIAPAMQGAERQSPQPARLHAPSRPPLAASDASSERNATRRLYPLRI